MQLRILFYKYSINTPFLHKLILKDNETLKHYSNIECHGPLSNGNEAEQNVPKTGSYFFLNWCLYGKIRSRSSSITHSGESNDWFEQILFLIKTNRDRNWWKAWGVSYGKVRSNSLRVTLTRIFLQPRVFLQLLPIQDFHLIFKKIYW